MSIKNYVRAAFLAGLTALPGCVEDEDDVICKITGKNTDAIIVSNAQLETSEAVLSAINLCQDKPSDVMTCVKIHESREDAEITKFRCDSSSLGTEIGNAFSDSANTECIRQSTFAGATCIVD